MFYIVTGDAVSEKIKATPMEKHFNADNFRAIALGIASDTIIIEATEAAYNDKMTELGFTPEQIKNSRDTIYMIMTEAMSACRSCDKHCSGLIRMKSSPFMDSYFCEIYAAECSKETRKFVETITAEKTPEHEKTIALAPD